MTKGARSASERRQPGCPYYGWGREVSASSTSFRGTAALEGHLCMLRNSWEEVIHDNLPKIQTLLRKTNCEPQAASPSPQFLAPPARPGPPSPGTLLSEASRASHQGAQAGLAGCSGCASSRQDWNLKTSKGKPAWTGLP